MIDASDTAATHILPQVVIGGNIRNTKSKRRKDASGCTEILGAYMQYLQPNNGNKLHIDINGVERGAERSQNKSLLLSANTYGKDQTRAFLHHDRAKRLRNTPNDRDIPPETLRESARSRHSGNYGYSPRGTSVRGSTSFRFGKRGVNL